MSRKTGIKEESLAPKRTVALVFRGALFLGAAVLVAWMSYGMILQMRREALLERLPARPDLSGSPEALRIKADEVQAALDRGPLGAGVGRLGNLYLANFFYDEAAQCYVLSMEIEPRTAQWPYLLAYVRAMKGETESTLELLNRAIALAPSYMPALLRRADERYKGSRPDEAAEDYREVLKTKPKDPYAHFGLARIAVDKAQWEEAQSHLEQTIAADPAFGNAHRLMASVHAHHGRSAEQEQALKVAEACGRFFPAPDPWVDELESLCYHVEKLLAKGYMAERTRKFEIARNLYERVTAIAPDRFEGVFRLGTVLLQHVFPVMKCNFLSAYFRQ